MGKSGTDVIEGTVTGLASQRNYASPVVPPVPHSPVNPRVFALRESCAQIKNDFPLEAVILHNGILLPGENKNKAKFIVFSATYTIKFSEKALQNAQKYTKIQKKGGKMKPSLINNEGNGER